MRWITIFVVLLQVIWDIPNQVFTVNASCYKDKHLAYWKTGFIILKAYKRL